jgi:hypothetical protein
MGPAALWMAACLLAPGAESPALAAPAAWVAASQDVAARLEELEKSFSDKESEFRAASRTARTAEERAEVMKLRPDPAEFSKRFAALAREAGRSETALTAWSRALELSVPAKDMELFDEAAERLLADFADSPALAKLPPMVARLTEGDRGPKLLQRMRESSGSDDVRAAATFHLALPMLDQRGELDAKAEARRKEGLGLMREIASEYPEAVDARGRTYASIAEGWIFQAERLQIGMVAPEIEGPDTSGVPFKLSDYRGKVVLLDFWGHW